MDTNELMPVGAWLRIELPGHPSVIAHTYVDPEMGFSAQGFKVDGTGLDQSTRMIVRLPMPGTPWRRLTMEEVQSFGLEVSPSWVTEIYGTQPMEGGLWGTWRDHPSLKGRFLPDHPDDLQVFVHDGGPRITRIPPELVWVSVNGVEGDVFQGRVLNQPHNLQTVKQGSVIRFVSAGEGIHPVMVTDKYLNERGQWTIQPCRKCGLAELFDAPSDLVRVVFPNSPPDAQMRGFTALCPLCGGFLMVTSINQPEPEDDAQPTPPSVPSPPPTLSKRPWWRFWG